MLRCKILLLRSSFLAGRRDLETSSMMKSQALLRNEAPQSPVMRGYLYLCRAFACDDRDVSTRERSRSRRGSETFPKT